MHDCRNVQRSGGKTANSMECATSYVFHVIGIEEILRNIVWIPLWLCFNVSPTPNCAFFFHDVLLLCGAELFYHAKTKIHQRIWQNWRRKTACFFVLFFLNNAEFSSFIFLSFSFRVCVENNDFILYSNRRNILINQIKPSKRIKNKMNTKCEYKEWLMQIMMIKYSVAEHIEKCVTHFFSLHFAGICSHSLVFIVKVLIYERPADTE